MFFSWSYDGKKAFKTIARSGYFVAAGLARGVDTEAHCGALEAPSGKTIAVLPWFHKIYPEENVKLAFDIAKNGALISEIIHLRLKILVLNRSPKQHLLYEIE